MKDSTTEFLIWGKLIKFDFESNLKRENPLARHTVQETQILIWEVENPLPNLGRISKKVKSASFEVVRCHIVKPVPCNSSKAFTLTLLVYGENTCLQMAAY